MELKENELDLISLYLQIGIVRNEIEMKKKSLKENLRLKKTCQKNDKDYDKTFVYLDACRTLLENDLKKKEEELTLLEAIALGKAPGMNGYFENAINENKVKNVKPYYEVFKNGEVGKISGYTIFEPLCENDFIVRFPKEIGVVESDVISVGSFCDALTFTIRNNFVNKPLLELYKIQNGKKEIEDISIEIIDKTGNVQYTIVYKKCSISDLTFPSLTYNSSEPQKITFNVRYRDLFLKNNATTDQEHSKENITE